MRELKIGEETLRVRATPLALLFYKQEFRTDLLGDLMKMDAIQKDLSQIDTVAILQLVYAMAKADSFGDAKKFPGFYEWVGRLDYIDFSDPEFLAAVMEEAANGFFRAGAKAGVKQEG